LEEAKRLAAEFEAMGGGALNMVLAQEAEPGDPLRECWLAHERLRVSEARSINRAELTARTDTAAEVAEVSAAEATAAEVPGRPMFSVGAREDLKTRGGLLSSEGANAAA